MSTKYTQLPIEDPRYNIFFDDKKYPPYIWTFEEYCAAHQKYFKGTIESCRQQVKKQIFEGLKSGKIREVEKGSGSGRYVFPNYSPRK
jgi:hypothetical protein